jgi:hypothetical protein
VRIVRGDWRCDAKLVNIYSIDCWRQI